MKIICEILTGEKPKKNHSYRWRQNLNNGIQKFERQSMCPYTKEEKCIPMLG